LQTGSKKYKLLHRVKDTRYFNIDNLHHYSLSLQLGSNDFQICVIDSRNSTCLLLEDYIFPSANSPEDRVAILKYLFDEHHFLIANFWKSVKISIKTSKFSLVPKDAFDKTALFDYLKYNADLDTSIETYRYNLISFNDIYTVFAFEKKVQAFFDTIYQNIEYQVSHQSCGIISGVFNSKNKTRNKKMYLYVDRGRLHISLIEDQRLIYYNQFLIKEFSDYIKFINLVAKELNYDIGINGIILWGYIRKNSAHLKELLRYFKNIKFGGSASFLKQGFMFDEIPEHHFIDVYGIYLCQ
jgi:hypothetical protein